MTLDEYLKCIKRINPDARVVVWEMDGELVPKWDEAHTGVKPTYDDCVSVLPTIQAEIKAIEDAEQARVTAKAQAIADNLPTWGQVDAGVTAISTLAEAKAFIRKLSRVVCWLAKDSVE